MLVHGYPKAIELLNGKQLTIRPLQSTDGDRLVRFFNSLPEDERVFTKRDVSQRKLVDRWVNNINFERVIPLLVLDGEEVVADGTLHLFPLGWMRHVGEIRILADPRLRNLGLRKLLMHELLACAIEVGLEKVLFLTFDTYPAAITLCTELGFEQVARLPDLVKDWHDQAHDMVVMVHDVNKLWKQLEDIVQCLDDRFRLDHGPGE